MLIEKVSPTGVDLAISKFQSEMFERFQAEFGDWDSYPRIYKNKRKNENSDEYFVAEHAKSKTEYQDVFYNDNLDMLSFFLKEDETEVSGRIATSKVSLIIQCDINNIYPSIPHRADEELKENIIMFAKPFGADFKLTDTVDGVDNVYREFRNDNLVWSNIAPRHVVRFDFDVRWTYDCGCC